ncbi:hypothetical protein NW851_08515 [Synechococcus sp. H55.7]|uniref:hypothetical protein n=1 Tax=unclassified Synechococcus TaxID=2626047 RepID=UPI0039C4A957
MTTSVKGYLLLAVSCLSAIAAVGSIFELASGEPDFGVGPTSIILVVAAPLAVWLFQSAVGAARSSGAAGRGGKKRK